MELEEGKPLEGMADQAAEQSSTAGSESATTTTTSPAPGGQSAPRPPIQPPLLGSIPPHNFPPPSMPPLLPPGLHPMPPPHMSMMVPPPLDPRVPVPLPLPVPTPTPQPVAPELVKQEPTGPRPVATEPIPGTPWSLVWTSDERKFFFNATNSVSVWSIPSDLVGNENLEQILENPPVGAGGKSEARHCLTLIACRAAGGVFGGYYSTLPPTLPSCCCVLVFIASIVHQHVSHSLAHTHTLPPLLPQGCFTVNHVGLTAD